MKRLMAVRDHRRMLREQAAVAAEVSNIQASVDAGEGVPSALYGGELLGGLLGMGGRASVVLSDLFGRMTKGKQEMSAMKIQRAWRAFRDARALRRLKKKRKHIRSLACRNITRVGRGYVLYPSFAYSFTNNEGRLCDSGLIRCARAGAQVCDEATFASPGAARGGVGNPARDPWPSRASGRPSRATPDPCCAVGASTLAWAHRPPRCRSTANVPTAAGVGFRRTATFFPLACFFILPSM